MYKGRCLLKLPSFIIGVGLETRMLDGMAYDLVLPWAVFQCIANLSNVVTSNELNVHGFLRTTLWSTNIHGIPHHSILL